jgi:hypothetical protein
MVRRFESWAVLDWAGFEQEGRTTSSVTMQAAYLLG